MVRKHYVAALWAIAMLACPAARADHAAATDDTGLTAPATDFTIVALPDTQMYTAELNGGTPAMLQAQTEWIVTNRALHNIVYVTMEGDISQDGSAKQTQWQIATNALYRLEDPVRTGLAQGIPYGVAVGNHDTYNGGTMLFNRYFGTDHFAGRAYYGGNYGGNNDSHYDLFSAGGMDFVVLSLTFSAGGDRGIMSWANGVLQSNATRRAIVVSHSLLNPADWPTPGPWTAEGPAIYNALSNNPNLFLMLCGHMHGEGRRQEPGNGRTIDLVLADYQSATNGGNGFLRLLEFSPSNDQIRVHTYSPYAGQSMTSTNSDFTLNYRMSGTPPFATITTKSGVLSGSQTSTIWTNLQTDACYEWYVQASDGHRTAAGPTNRFRTATSFRDGAGKPR